MNGGIFADEPKMEEQTAAWNMNTSSEILKGCSILRIISILSRDHNPICLDITLQSVDFLHVRYLIKILSKWQRKIGV